MVIKMSGTDFIVAKLFFVPHFIDVAKFQPFYEYIRSPESSKKSTLFELNVFKKAEYLFLNE